MSRITKTLKALQREMQSSQQNNDESPQSLDISSIEKASFFQGNRYSPHGNPLHSTALEEDLSAGTEPDRSAGTTDRSAGKTADSRADQGKTQAFPKGVNTSAASKENQEPSSNEAVVRKAAGRALAAISEAGDETGEGRTTARKSGAAGRGQRSSLSSEELTDDDQSFHPNMEKPRGGKRRSSSRQQRNAGEKHRRKSSLSEKAGPAKKPRVSRSPSDLDVVLDIFQEFVSEYKQTIMSDAVKRSIDAVSRSFEEQLSEIITATNELKHVKRENNKINTAINKKRTRLVEASNELIRVKTKLAVLQKEHDGMDLRLRSLREGSSLLSGLQELNRKYREHRTAHPQEVETYGPSCMPAMLMEARCIMGTEHQLKTINDNLQQVLDQTDSQ